MGPFSTISDPVWADDEKTRIRVSALLEGERVPFVASATDCMEYGREIFAACLAGEFGTIAEKPLLSQEEVYNTALAMNENILKEKLSMLTSEENKARAIVDEEFSSAWKAAISSLLSVKNQSEWPIKVIWPDIDV